MQFSYIAKDKTGKTISGIEEAANKAALVNHLQGQGFYVINIQALTAAPTRGTATPSRKMNFTHNNVTLDDRLSFCRQLGTMINTGVTLLRSLDIISMQVDSKKFSEILARIKKEVEEGSSLSVSLSKHPKIFDRMWVSLIEVGEASGNLPLVLDKLAFYLEQQASFQSALVSAIIYPLILLIVSFLAIIFFAFVIGPKFKDLFESFDVQLPILTVVLLGIFDLIKTKFFVLIAVGGGILFLISRYAQTPMGRLQLEKILFKLPKFGYVFRTIIVERFTSQMSILVDSGVPILYALDITQRMVGNKTCESVIGKIKESVREGKLIAETMAQSGFFPPMAVQMILVGEETGELGKMLKSVSEYYQNYISTFMKRFGTIFEPIMLIFMGVTIGTIVIAMFLPIFSIAQLGGAGG